VWDVTATHEAVGPTFRTLRIFVLTASLGPADEVDAGTLLAEFDAGGQQGAEA